MNSRLPHLTDLLDEAVHLLRGAPAKIWLSYLIGALPFAAGSLAIAQRAALDRNLAQSFTAEAFLLAMLYLWMCACRLRFAQDLFRRLEADVAEPLSAIAGAPARTVSRLVLSVAELLVLPLAALAIVPLPWAVAFFRSTAYVPAEQDGRLRNVIRSTSQRASLGQRQNWFILLFILAFALVILVNLIVLLLFLPSLYRTFSGYENEFTRNSMATMFGPVFMVAVALTWVCIEPLLLAIYALRSFYADARETGRDLLVVLARIATCLLILGCGSLHAATVPAKEEPRLLKREVHQVLQQSRYDWRMDLDKPPQKASVSRFPLLQAFADGVNNSLKTIGKWMRELAAYLDKILRSNKNSPPDEKNEPANRSVQTIVYVLIGCVAVVLIAFLGIRLKRQRSAASPVSDISSATAIDLADEALLASDLPEDEWLALSRRYIGEGNGRLAVRSLYLANLAWLARHNLLTVSAFKSNREYQRELGRRTHKPEIAIGFARNLARFERTWYGRYEPDAELIASFEDDLRGMKGAVDG